MEHFQKLLSQLEGLNLTSKNIEIRGIKAVGGYSDTIDGRWKRDVVGEEISSVSRIICGKISALLG